MLLSLMNRCSLNFYPVSTSTDMQGWNNLTNGAHLLANALLFRQDVTTTKTTVQTMTTTTSTVNKNTTSTTLFNKTTNTSPSTTFRSITQQSTTIEATSTSSSSTIGFQSSMDSFMPPTIIAIVVGVLLLVIAFGLILIIAMKCRKTSSNVKTGIAINGNVYVLFFDCCFFLIKKYVSS